MVYALYGSTKYMYPASGDSADDSVSAIPSEASAESLWALASAGALRTVNFAACQKGPRRRERRERGPRTVKGVQLWTIEARRWSWRRERPHEARDGANGAQARAEHTIAATSSAHAVCGGAALLRAGHRQRAWAFLVDRDRARLRGTPNVKRTAGDGAAAAAVPGSEGSIVQTVVTSVA